MWLKIKQFFKLIWLKIKQFFKIMKYELIRVTRNKVVFSLLLLFSVGLLLMLSFVQVNSNQYPIAVFTDGQNIDDCEVMQLIDKNLATSKIIYVKSKEEGIETLKSNKVCFFICLDSGDENDEVTATFYYDQTNAIGNAIVANLSDVKNEYAYQTMTDFLYDYGITINKTYFDVISFEQASTKHVNIRQMSFAVEVTCCASIIMMLGLAYSIARDNETQVSKNICYIPIGTNKYLLSKAIPYVLLGMIEMALMYLLGMWLFEINFEINFFLVLLLSIFFVMAIVTLSLIFSLLKSQIATIFLNMLAILLPLFVSIVTYVQACPLYIQIILNCLPVIPFINFLNGMMFYGIILWWTIPIFITQIIIYYIIALFILKRRIKT